MTEQTERLERIKARADDVAAYLDDWYVDFASILEDFPAPRRREHIETIVRIALDGQEGR